MGKILALSMLLLLALGSAAGYLYLTQQIDNGSPKMIAGEKQIEEGEKMLSNGKANLSRGSRQLSQAKQGRNQIKKISYGLMAAVPVTGLLTMVGDKVVSGKISEGDRMVAAGKKKVAAGEEQLASGKLELSRGKSRLSMAMKLRTACVLGAVMFTIIFIMLSFYWRHSLVTIIMRKNS